MFKQRYATGRWQRFMQAFRGLCEAVFMPNAIADRRLREVSIADRRAGQTEVVLAMTSAMNALMIVKDEIDAKLAFSTVSHPVNPDYDRMVVHIMKGDEVIALMIIDDGAVLKVGDRRMSLNLTKMPGEVASFILDQLDYPRL